MPVSSQTSYERILRKHLKVMRQIVGERNCEELLKSSLNDFMREPSLSGGRAYYQGALLGQHLAYHLELARILRGCSR